MYTADPRGRTETERVYQKRYLTGKDPDKQKTDLKDVRCCEQQIEPARERSRQMEVHIRHGKSRYPLGKGGNEDIVKEHYENGIETGDYE